MKLEKLTMSLLGATCIFFTSCSSSQNLETGGRLVGKAPSAASRLPNLVQYARPICGTGTAVGVVWGDNNCFPGATVPLGMIQWSPDTEAGDHPAGYSYSDSRISDFSMDHLSGAGCSYGEDFAFMPLLGEVPTSPPDGPMAFAAAFSHSNEITGPG